MHVSGESVEYPSPCPACAAVLTCHGGQALVGRSIEWSIESHCAACGWTLAECGRGDGLPPALRERLLARHGPTRLRLADPSAGAVTVMKVVRAELGGDLSEARDTLRRIRADGYTGTLAEITRLARCLERAGVRATAVRAEAVS